MLGKVAAAAAVLVTCVTIANGQFIGGIGPACPPTALRGRPTNVQENKPCGGYCNSLGDCGSGLGEQHLRSNAAASGHMCRIRRLLVYARTRIMQVQTSTQTLRFLRRVPAGARTDRAARPNRECRGKLLPSRRHYAR